MPNVKDTNSNKVFAILDKEEEVIFETITKMPRAWQHNEERALNNQKEKTWEKFFGRVARPLKEAIGIYESAGYKCIELMLVKI